MPGVIAMGVSLPSKDRWIGVWYGEVMSRVIIGGVVGKSSTMIAIATAVFMVRLRGTALSYLRHHDT